MMLFLISGSFLLLLDFQVIDSRGEESHLLIIFGVHVVLNDPVASLMLVQIEEHCIFECHGLLVLIRVALHELVNLDTLKWTDLSDMLLDRRETSSHTNHDLVRLDHQYGDLSANHILAFVSGGLLL